MILMVYVNTITTAQKDKKIQVIMRRDGNICFYCMMPFIEEIKDLHRVIDHLNDNPEDNRVENLVIAHAICNQKKKNNYDWKIMANEKLESNTTLCSASLSENGREKKDDTDELTEGDINLIANKLVKAELSVKLPEGSINEISYSKTLRGLHYLLIEQTGGRGSEPAIRRALDAHCSEYAPWIDVKKGRGNRIIRRRKSPENV